MPAVPIVPRPIKPRLKIPQLILVVTQSQSP